MPTYDYACSLCGHRFEHFAPMSAEPLVRCPACQRDGLQRLIGPGAGILFKGSGFYETDYKRAPAASPSKDDATKAEPAKAAPSSDGKAATPPADPKPATKGSAPKDKPAS